MSDPRVDLQSLGERLAREQDALLAENRGPAALGLSDRGDLVERGAARRREPRRAWQLVGVGVFAVSLALVLATVVLRARPLELTIGDESGLSGQWITAPVDRSVPVQFSDGTLVTLDCEGYARVFDVTARGAHFMLESGTAQARVTPNRNGRWTFSAGPFTVEVRGTRFELGWSPREQLFRLTLLEGKVAISGCAVGESRLLLAGETMRASCLTNDFQIFRTPPGDAIAPPSPPLTDVQESPEPAPLGSGGSIALPLPAPSSGSPGGVVSGSGSPGAVGESWQALARASKFKASFARASEKGFDAELRRADVEELVLLGDVARLSGHPAHAMRAYQKVRDRAPGTDSAANAAFSMGRVTFDQRDAYGDAARWFATYLSERADGPLAREALGRRMEALSRAGDPAGAARVAEQYLQQYPEGPHAPLARTLRTGPE